MKKSEEKWRKVKKNKEKWRKLRKSEKKIRTIGEMWLQKEKIYPHAIWDARAHTDGTSKEILVL